MALYACGDGESSNLNMSRTRATLNAKSQLADMIDSEISSRMEDFLSSVGTGSNEQIQQQSEIITKNVTIEAKLTGYKQIQAEVQNIGSKFQVYVLLEYPVGKANQALVNQIKQDEILSTQEAADAALAELEAEINKRRATRTTSLFFKSPFFLNGLIPVQFLPSNVAKSKTYLKRTSTRAASPCNSGT